METVLDNYVTTLQEIENLTELSEHFQDQIVNISTNDQSNTKVLVATAAMMTSSSGYKHQEASTNSNCWWDQFAADFFLEDECISSLRCSRQTYLYLVKKLSCHITKNGDKSNETLLNKGIPAEKQIAITLYRLGTRKDLDEIAEKFGVEKSVVYPVIHEIIFIICKHLLPVVIKMPGIEEAIKISEYFESFTKIPQIIGVMNNIHIPVSHKTLPKPSLFLNSQKYHSFILQAVVDSNNCFTDISVRYPGCVLDSRVLQDSSIFKCWRKVIPSVSKHILGVDIPFQIIGPISYPLLPWLLKGYKISTIRGEVLLNSHIDITKNVVLNAVKRMRARFSILSEELDLNFQIAPQLIAACCILHNICERNNDALLEEWLVDSENLLLKYPQPMKQHSKQVEIEPIAIKHRNIIQQYLEQVMSTYEFIECDNETTHIAYEDTISIESDLICRTEEIQ